MFSIRRSRLLKTLVCIVYFSMMAKTPYRALLGMLSYMMGHTKPNIAYALNVLSRYCNNPGRRHVEFLLCLLKYCEYSKDDRLKCDCIGITLTA